MSICKSCGFRNPPGRRSCVKCNSVFRSGGGGGVGKALGGIFILLFVIAAAGALLYKLSERSNPPVAPKGGLYENRASTHPGQPAPPVAKRTTPTSTSTSHPPKPAPKPPEKKPIEKQAPPPALPKSQFESILAEASGHFDKREFRRSYNLYKAAAAFQKLPKQAAARKDTAYAMWSLKEANRDMDLRESVDPAWARLTRARLATLDYNAFPTEADKKKYMETMQRLQKLSGGDRPRGSGNR